MRNRTKSPTTEAQHEVRKIDYIIKANNATAVSIRHTIQHSHLSMAHCNHRKHQYSHLMSSNCTPASKLLSEIPLCTKSPIAPLVRSLSSIQMWYVRKRCKLLFQPSCK